MRRWVCFSDECTPHVKADIVFVLDASMSLGSSLLRQHKNFVKNFASKFRVGPLNYRYQFSLVTYAYDVIVHFHLDTYQNDTDLATAVEMVSNSEDGPSLTDKAIEVVVDEILPRARTDGRVFSDKFN